MTEELGVTPTQETQVSETTAPETVQTEQDTPQAEESTQPSESEKLKAAYDKRISRITAARHAEARRADDLQKQLEALRTPQEEPGKPKESEFDSVEEYNKAIGRYEAEQDFKKKETERQTKETESRRVAEVSKLQKAHQAKEAEFRKDNPQYDEHASIVNEAVSLANRDTPEFKAFADAMITSDNMAALTNYLGENLDVLEGLFSKNAAGIYREIAKIEAILATPPETEEVEIKQVSAPPRPIGGTGKVSKPIDQMSYEEIKKAWKL